MLIFPKILVRCATADSRDRSSIRRQTQRRAVEHQHAHHFPYRPSSVEVPLQHPEVSMGSNGTVDDELGHLTGEQLQLVKKDLEARLARFQRAFFDQHGRNPNEEERAPANPAIKKYRLICQEIAAREQRAESDAPDAQSAPVARMGELAADQQVHTSMQDAVKREATRNAAEKTSVATDGAGSGAMGASKAAEAASFTSLLGGSAMIDLAFNWGQLAAIWGEVTTSISARMTTEFPDYDLSAFAPWVVDLELHVFKYINVFNLDLKAFQANFDLSFLSLLGWREMHLGFTVLLPLIVSFVTVVLLRDLADIARLAILTVS